MEFGDKMSKLTVGEVVTGTATEGGAVVAGLLSAGFLGKQIEKNIGTAGSKAVLPTSPMTDKLIGYAANNLPKLALWYVVRKEGGKYLGKYDKDVGKGILSDVVLDTLIRATNSGAPKDILNMFGYSVLNNNTTPQMQENMQKVLQENSSLRQQLNGALQRAASAPSPIQAASPVRSITPIQSAPQVIAQPPADHDRRFSMMQSTPEAEERRKNYGAMTPPLEDERNKRYSSMKAQYNFAGDSTSASTAFGML